MGDTNLSANPQQGNTTEPGATGDFIKKQPLVALSGLGAALTAMKGLMRQVRKASQLKSILPYQIKKFIPRYMRSNYFRYPAILLLLLATTRKLRLMLDH